MKNKKRNKIFLLVVLLLGITIGFAALATTLKINGNATITKNTWNIYWDNIANESGVTPDSETEILDEDEDHPKNIVSFEVTFDKPGDYYEFEVDAVNAGTLDAEILSIEKKYNNTLIPAVEDPNNRVVPAYLKYEVVYADTGAPAVGDKLAKRTDATHFTTRTYRIRVEYDRDAVTNTDINTQDGNVTHIFSFSVQYGQASKPQAVAFTTDDWSVIAAEGNQAATQTSVTGGKCGAYNLGDTKIVKIDMDGDNTPEDYTVRISNCSTPAVCSTEGFSETSCGFIIEFVDILSKHRMNATDNADLDGNYNTGGWKYSDMRAYLNNGTYVNTYPTIDEVKDYSTTGVLSKLPNDLQAVLNETTVVSGHGCKYSDLYGVCQDPDNNNNNFTTTDKLYLLAAPEVVGKVGNNRSVEYDSAINNTRQLDYYESTGLTPDPNSAFSAQKRYNGALDHWVTRTPYDTDYSPWYVVSDYSSLFEGSSSKQYGVAPAFKLK